jgi:hypothetical protein
LTLGVALHLNREISLGRSKFRHFVAALAFLLARALEKKLKAAGVPMSSAQHRWSSCN